MRYGVIFGGQKRTLGGPFGLQSALLFIFLKNFSQCLPELSWFFYTVKIYYYTEVDSPLDMYTINEKQKEDTELVARMNKH